MKVLSGLAFFLTFLSPNVWAQWDLSNDSSRLNFVTVKSLKIGEVHRFEHLTGSISDTGQVTLNIDLNSVETNIGIRNERIKKQLFETDNFLQATASGFINVNKVARLEVGDTYTESVQLTLSFHGIAHKVTNDVQVTKLKDDKLSVTSLMPLVINASNYGLTEGVEKLRALAGLPSISDAVPVTFSLIFNP
ncbi:YceI family protein [Psychromonas sp. B3M02]|uniref:YceI family protein n=1 Tax=Psychromonas sp. B3M02 TaxID=2267226 RepID=UPI0015F0D028|nr:YceI family protein [Psychromonas sp. B3M02]